MPVCPTFFKSKDQFRTPAEVCADLIVFSVRNPGSVTNLYSEDEISLYKLKNTYEQSKDILAGKYQELLSRAINKYFPDNIINVQVEAEFINEAEKTYKLTINIVYSEDSVPVIGKTDVIINEDGKFDINFH